MKPQEGTDEVNKASIWKGKEQLARWFLNEISSALPSFLIHEGFVSFDGESES